MRTVNPKVLLADGEYEIAKAKCNGSQVVTIPIIERRLKLAPGTLTNYRANYYSRKSRTVIS